MGREGEGNREKIMELKRQERKSDDKLTLPV